MWKVEYTKRFLKELASLPQDIQSSIRLIVFQELEADKALLVSVWKRGLY